MSECPFVCFGSIHVCINLTLGFVVERVGVVGNRKEIEVSNLCSMSKCFFTASGTVREIGV